VQAKSRMTNTSGGLSAHYPASRIQKRSLTAKLRYVAVSVAVIWGVYQYAMVQRPQLAVLHGQEAQLQSQLASLQQTHIELTKREQQFHDDKFIAAYASSHFNLVLPGQVAFDDQH